MNASWLVRTLVVCGVVSALAAPGVAQERPAVGGSWKLLVLPFHDDEFAVVKFADAEGKLTGELQAAQPVFDPAKLSDVSLVGQTLTFKLRLGPIDTDFVATVAKDRAAGDAIRGSYQFRGQYFPARLEATDKAELGPLRGAGPVRMEIAQLSREPDAEKRVAGMKEVIKNNPDDPRLAFAYLELLESAEQIQAAGPEVQQWARDLIANAKPYGGPWLKAARLNALDALGGQKPYAELLLTLAQEAETALGAEATTEQKVRLANAVAGAAEQSGKADLAKETRAKLAALEAELDAEYLKTVPPFAVKPFAGRQDPAHTRVVLVELFTGAECPPCVAADVAFDGLLKAYQPSEIVGLQYHLHIPGPDPLTTEQSEKRSEYYEVGGTPSIFFNGQSDERAQGGGGMAASEAMFGEYQEILAERLKAPKGASVQLTVVRKGDVLEIAAQAKTAEAQGEDDLRLRLALTEESIRYVGGNRLRFHHHVVRALPGGVEGQPLQEGQGEVKLTVNLAELRAAQQKYVDDFGRFPRATPEIALKDLSVAAFVQNHKSREVLHAVQQAVEEPKSE